MLYNPPLCCDICKEKVGQDGIVEENLFYCSSCLIEKDYDLVFLAQNKIMYNLLLEIKEAI